MTRHGGRPFDSESAKRAAEKRWASAGRYDNVPEDDEFGYCTWPELRPNTKALRF
jgi:hypothetical protein